MQKSWYIVLNISINSTEEEIKAAYKKLARKYHPDLMINAAESERFKAQEKMKEINKAYEEALKYASNPNKGSVYTTTNTRNYNNNRPFSNGKTSYDDYDFFTQLFREAFRDTTSEEELRKVKERIISRMTGYVSKTNTSKNNSKKETQEQVSKTKENNKTTTGNFEQGLKRQNDELERYKVRAKIMQYYPFVPIDEYDDIIDEVIKQNRIDEDNFDDILILKAKIRKR